MNGFVFSRKVKENLRESGEVEGRDGSAVSLELVEESAAETDMFPNGLSVVCVCFNHPLVICN